MISAKQNTLRIKYLLHFLLILFLSIISSISFPQEKNNKTYIIKEGDNVLSILRKNKLTPIYGKNGYLSEIIKLNPEKIQEEGNLIYPKNEIMLPIKRLELTIPDNISYTEYKRSIKKFKTKFSNFKDNDEYVYMIYTVKNFDMTSILLQKLQAIPIYGPYGSLNFTIELNPKKRLTKGDLIFPREKILLFIPMNIALSLMQNEDKSVLIFKGKPKELNKNTYQDMNNFYTFNELGILYRNRENSKLNLKLKNEEQMEFIENTNVLDSKKDEASALDNKNKESSNTIYEDNAYNTQSKKFLPKNRLPITKIAFKNELGLKFYKIKFFV